MQFNADLAQQLQGRYVTPNDPFLGKGEGAAGAAERESSTWSAFAAWKPAEKPVAIGALGNLVVSLLR
jgi:hypothetical protein